MLLDTEEKAQKEEAEHKACMHEINSFRDSLGASGARSFAHFNLMLAKFAVESTAVDAQ